MSTTLPNSPMLLDSTGQVIAQKLQGIINALGGGGGTVIIEEYDSSVLRYPNSNEDGGYTYKVGDYCSYNDAIYFCNTPITWNSSTPPEFDATKWYDATNDIVAELSKKPGIVIASPNQYGSSFIELFGNIGTHQIYNSGHDFTHVEGWGNKVGDSNDTSKVAQNSHVEGYGNTICGYSTHAEGENTSALGRDSHSEGYNTKSKGNYSHAEGSNSNAYGTYSHVEGAGNSTGTSDKPEAYFGTYSHAEGQNNYCYGTHGHVEGSNNSIGTSDSPPPYSHAEGYTNRVFSDTSHAEGRYNYIYQSGSCSHVEGESNSIYGSYNHVEGCSNSTDSSNPCLRNHLEGYQNHIYQASNGPQPQNNHVEGQSNYIYSGMNCHAEGYSNYCYGQMAAHVEGMQCYANSVFAHAGGQTSYAGAYGRTDAAASFAHGIGVHSHNAAEAGFGRYNATRDGRRDINAYAETGKSYTTGDKVKYQGTIYEASENISAPAGEFDQSKWTATSDTYESNPSLFTVGNGMDSSNTSNAFEVREDGTGYLKNNKRIITTEEVPDPPTTDGTYTLQVTVSNGQLTYSWV